MAGTFRRRLLGEQVAAERGGYTVVETLAPVDCKHFDRCGGCSLPRVPYADQLARKRARLAHLFGMEVAPLVASPRETAFRQKAAFVFGSSPHGRTLVMGHYAAKTSQIVPIEECPVHSPRANRVAMALRDRLVHAGIGAADVPGGIVRHLIIRTTEDDREAAAMLVVAKNDRRLRGPVRSLLASKEAPDGFFININVRPGPYMVGNETIKIAGRSRVREKSLAVVPGRAGIDFLISPDAFFQTNVGAARALVALVLEGVGGAGRVLDLYSGSGLFALPLAANGARVTAVEESRKAIDDLRTNATFNGIAPARLTSIVARVEDALARLGREPWEAVVLDPPRDGCAPGVLTAVFHRMQPARAVYVSCNPDALARELPDIVHCGYRVDRLQAIDMFPHTDHIEVVAVLSSRGSPRTMRPDTTPQ